MRWRRSKVAVVTGASAGVGRAIVREYASHGYDVALLARGRDGLEGARREVEQMGRRALVLPVDISHEDEVEQAAETIEQELGPIDVWINNAMVSVLSPVTKMTADEYRRVTEVTYLGYVWGTMSALKRMLPRKRGAIVQIGSALAYRAIPLQSAYCAAKHAVVGFTESLRCELLHDKSKVNVTMVQLPGINTPQFEWIRNRLPNTPQPLGTVFQPEVAARAAYAASRTRRREIFVGMPALKPVLGDRLAPGLMDHYMASIVYEGHQTDTPENPNRSDNLYTPVAGDHGARGRFNARAKESSPYLWLTTHGRTTVITLAALLAAGASLVLGSPRKTPEPSQPKRLMQRATATLKKAKRSPARAFR